MKEKDGLGSWVGCMTKEEEVSVGSLATDDGAAQGRRRPAIVTQYSGSSHDRPNLVSRVQQMVR